MVEVSGISLPPTLIMESELVVFSVSYAIVVQINVHLSLRVVTNKSSKTNPTK